MAYMNLLCSHLLSLPEGRLQYLDDERDLSLPKVRDKPKRMAVRDIRGYLMRMPSLRRHLECVAHIYCFLVEQGAIQPWELYRLDRRRGNHAALVGDVLDSFLHRESGCCTKITSTFSCTCLMTPDEEGWMVHTPCFFCIWPAPSCVAVHQPPPGYSPVVSRALLRIVGEQPDAFRCGIYQDLNEAHDAARRLIW